MQLPERQSVLHSWCVQADWDAPTVAGGAGARFRDDQGREYLDMSSLAECCNLGHQHPAVVRAIQEQAGRLCFTTSAWGAAPRAELAQALLEKSGFTGGRVFFTLGGADANEQAVKFARLATGRPQGAIITRDRSYHGASYGAMALSGDLRVQGQVDPAALGVVRCRTPYAYRCPFGTDTPDACAEAAAADVDGLLEREPAAAVLMEPDAGTNGIVAPDAYWPLLRQATRRRGALLIADEVMSGFGRCGEWFAWQRHGEAGRPDLMTLSKGLTGGHLPLGAVVLSAAVAGQLEHRMLQSGLTYCGHPLACAAGLAALRAYAAEGLIDRSRQLGRALYGDLLAMAEHHPSVGEVRGGHGLFAVLELVSDRASRAPLAPWGQEAPALKALAAKARAEGVLFATRSNLIILAPPLVIAEADLRHALTVLDRLLTELERP